MIGLSLAGCTRGPEVVAGPELEAPADAPLTRILTASTDVPTHLTAHLRARGLDAVVTWPDAARDHRVLLLGTPPDAAVDVELTFDDGARSTSASLAYDTDPLPDDFPDLEVLTLDPDAVAPGYRLLPLEPADAGPLLAAIDAWTGEVTFLYTGPENLGDVELTAAGTLLGLGVGALELDLAGEVLHRWDDRGDDLDPTWIPVTFRAEHHEVTEVGPDELVTLTHRALAVDTYPRSYEPPRIELPATLEDTGVVRFRRDGTVLSTWWYGDVLDTRRIGFDSLDGAGLGYDWVHGNAVVRRPEGGWLASARHQDALFALDDDGALEWILASPAGWSDALAPKVLALDGTPTYHQHGPAYDDAGRLVVFDNHNEGHNPYEPPPEGPVQSRVVAYEIDAPAHRAREVWSWTHPDGLYSAALGNATPVPGGNVVACYGFLDGEGPDDAAALGLGRKISRIVELRPGVAEPVSDVRFSVPADEGPEGVKAYRAVPAASLYARDVHVDRRLP